MLNLTKTEFKYVHLLALGNSEKEIASKMFLSEQTVHTHARNVRKKTNSRSAVDVVRKYILSLEDPKKVLIGMFFLTIELVGLGGSYSGDDVRALKSQRSSRQNISAKVKQSRKIDYGDTFIV